MSATKKLRRLKSVPKNQVSCVKLIAEGDVGYNRSYHSPCPAEMGYLQIKISTEKLSLKLPEKILQFHFVLFIRRSYLYL